MNSKPTQSAQYRVTVSFAVPHKVHFTSGYTVSAEDMPDKDYPLYMAASEPIFTRAEIINLTSTAIATLAVIGVATEAPLVWIANFFVVTLAGAPIALAIAYMLVNAAKGRIE